MMKRWHKPKGVRVHPIQIRDAVAKDNERALVECARMSKEQQRQALKRLQNLISGIVGA